MRNVTTLIWVNRKKPEIVETIVEQLIEVIVGHDALGLESVGTGRTGVASVTHDRPHSPNNLRSHLAYAFHGTPQAHLDELGWQEKHTLVDILHFRQFFVFQTWPYDAVPFMEHGITLLNSQVFFF